MMSRSLILYTALFVHPPATVNHCAQPQTASRSRSRTFPSVASRPSNHHNTRTSARASVRRNRTCIRGRQTNNPSQTASHLTVRVPIGSHGCCGRRVANNSLLLLLRSDRCDSNRLHSRRTLLWRRRPLHASTGDSALRRHLHGVFCGQTLFQAAGPLRRVVRWRN